MIHLDSANYTDVIQAAQYANVSRATINAWITSNQLKSVKLGGAHIIKLDDLKAAMVVERKRGRKSAKEKETS